MWQAQLLNNIVALLDSGVAASTTSYESIATVTVGAGDAFYVEFTSIPSTYKHLQIRLIAKWTYPGVDLTNCNISINSGTGNANSHRLGGDGSSATASNPGADYFPSPYIPSGRTDTFGAGVIDILDYTDTNKYKTVRGLGGFDANGSGRVSLASAYFATTSAISSIKIFPDNYKWAQYSSFALYGVKG